MSNKELYVHVIVYNDLVDGYVGLDAFATFNAALRQFDRRLRETRQDFGSGMIEKLVRNPVDYRLYFRDKTGYEVFYRRELIQS